MISTVPDREQALKKCYDFFYYHSATRRHESRTRGHSHLGVNLETNTLGGQSPEGDSWGIFQLFKQPVTSISQLSPAVIATVHQAWGDTYLPRMHPNCTLKLQMWTSVLLSQGRKLGAFVQRFTLTNEHIWNFLILCSNLFFFRLDFDLNIHT